MSSKTNILLPTPDKKDVKEIEKIVHEDIHVYFDMYLFSKENVTILANMNHEITHFD